MKPEDWKLAHNLLSVRCAELEREVKEFQIAKSELLVACAARCTAYPDGPFVIPMAAVFRALYPTLPDGAA